MAFAALRRGLDLVARKTAQALVTAPLSKTALSLAGLPHDGQTEFLASASGRPRAQMILLAPRMRLCCALNPHAGDAGLFGNEETGVLAKAASLALRRGLPLSGPLPADAAWHEHRVGSLSGLVCLYHDQALIALKAVAGFGVVNWTVGLPFVRTSPGHGTGFDLAASSQAFGLVEASGTIEAMGLAARLCARRSREV